MMMNKRLRPGTKFIFFPIIAIVFISLAGYVVMLLWNAILPEVIKSVRPVTYTQAIGLLILARILFGGFKGRGGYGGGGMNKSSGWKEKMAYMSEEEREKFRDEWKNRCQKK